MNDFEKYIQANKRKLEVEPPQANVWMEIENQVLKQKNKRMVRYMKWMSAAAVVLLGMLLWNVDAWKGSDTQADLLEIYGLDQYNFTQQVNIKKQNLSKATIPVKRKDDFDRLLRQLEFLDQQYDDYLAYIQEHGYQEFIGAQILDYYQTKIQLLDKIQQEISKINHYENKYKTDSESIGLGI